MELAEGLSASIVAECRVELVDRFAPQQKAVSLRQSACPALASAAIRLFGVDQGSDRDLQDFVHATALFAAQASRQERHRALLQGGLAFLFCKSSPNDHDFFLIQQGNPGVRASAMETKRVRDTWAFMTFKRAMSANPDISYSAKSGQNMRPEFRETLADAVQFSLERWAEFRTAATEIRAAEQQGVLAGGRRAPAESAMATSSVDLSELVSETFPDGTMVPFGVAFVKSWTVRNTGNVPWIGRSLTRVTPRTPMFPHTAESVPVPDTMPGQTATVTVDVVATRLHGFSEVRFKMVDAEGTLCWPRQYPYGLAMIVETRDMVWVQRRSGLTDVPWED